MNEKDLDDKLRVQENMIKYGGSFVEKLGHALSCADSNNTKRIKRAFPEYWNKYLNAGYEGPLEYRSDNI
jgi:hypothetical protein